MAELLATQIPGYVAGKWSIDPTHTEIGFTVLHMMISKVCGRFKEFSGEIVTGENPADSSVTADIKTASFTTDNEQRDGHIKFADFLEAETWPDMTYRSTGVRIENGDFIVDGELTLKGVTKSVPLTLELNGFGPDPYGGTRAGFTAVGEIKRSDFGVDFNAALETGGVVVGDKVALELEIEAVLRAE